MNFNRALLEKNRHKAYKAQQRSKLLALLAAFGVILTPFLIWAAAMAGIIYVVVHFLRKFW